METQYNNEGKLAAIMVLSLLCLPLLRHPFLPAFMCQWTSLMPVQYDQFALSVVNIWRTAYKGNTFFRCGKLLGRVGAGVVAAGRNRGAGAAANPSTPPAITRFVKCKSARRRLQCLHFLPCSLSLSVSLPVSLGPTFVPCFLRRGIDKEVCTSAAGRLPRAAVNGCVINRN